MFFRVNVVGMSRNLRIGTIMVSEFGQVNRGGWSKRFPASKHLEPLNGTKEILMFNMPKLAAAASLLPAMTRAADSAQQVQVYMGNVGVSGVWVLANISFAGMRAQGHPSKLWRVLSFLGGFPGTVITWLAVKEGSCRAYGITLPQRPAAG